MCVFNLRKTTFLTKIDREIFLPSPNINPSLIVFVARPLASLARGTWVGGDTDLHSTGQRQVSYRRIMFRRPPSCLCRWPTLVGLYMWQGGDQIASCGWLSVCPYRGDTVLVVACKNRIRRSHPSTSVLSSHPPTQRDWHAVCLSHSRGLTSALIVTSGQTLRHPSLPGFLFVHNRTERKGQIFACSRSVWIEWRAIVVPWLWWRHSWKKVTDT